MAITPSLIFTILTALSIYILMVFIGIRLIKSPPFGGRLLLKIAVWGGLLCYTLIAIINLSLIFGEDSNALSFVHLALNIILFLLMLTGCIGALKTLKHIAQCAKK